MSSRAPAPSDATALRTAVPTRSTTETRALAAALAAVSGPGDRLALMGPLGAGKTQFAKGFAAGLGVTDVVNSPSFTLMAEYRGRLPLFHQDLYRLSGADEALGGGLIDARQETGVTLTEWAERLPAELDTDRLEIRFTVPASGASAAEPETLVEGADEDRLIELTAVGPRYVRYVDAARRWRDGLGIR